MGERRRRVAWAHSARDALDQAAQYIAEDSPLAAQRLVERALAAAESLEALAIRGRVVPELDTPAVRELLVERFRLIFEVGEEAVTILAFVHGARDFERWREGEP